MEICSMLAAAMIKEGGQYILRDEIKHEPEEAPPQPNPQRLT
jgi:hypothetical protein